jgi:hypothetical protein
MVDGNIFKPSKADSEIYCQLYFSLSINNCIISTHFRDMIMIK